MRICIAVPSLATAGGAERVVCEEASFFTENGDTVFILVADYESDVTDAYGVPDDVTVFRTEGSLLADVKRTREVLREHAIDVVLTHSFTKRLYLATRPFGDRTPYVPHVHGSVLWFVDDPNRLPHADDPDVRALIEDVPGHGEFYDQSSHDITTRTAAHVNEWLEGRALRAAPRVTTGSLQVRREVNALYGAHAQVVRPGVPASWVDNYESVSERRLDNHETTILSVSRLDSRKRIDILVEAIAGLRNAGRDIGLVVAGAGPKRDALETLVADHNLEDAVTFAGFVPETDLASYYKSADVFACPGWMSYGITPLEAYAMRTPVGVSTDAFVNEVLSGEPGTAVLAPDAETWMEGLSLLSDCEPRSLRPDVVPTWDDFCTEIARVVEDVVE